MEEKILLNIEFNNSDIQKAVTNISEGRQAIDKLIEANKKLAEQGLKNSQTYVTNQETIKALNVEVNSNSKIVQANTQAVSANGNAIDNLKKRNSELLKERNKIDTSTEEGRKKIAALNAEYDKNAIVIKENSTNVEKQRFNIGNYQNQLNAVVPGLGNFAKGLDTAAEGQKSLTGASKAFIATGIGLVVVAIGLAFGALMSYLKGSEEGQDKLNKIMAIGSAIFEQFMNVVEAVGEAIFNAIENPQQALEDFGDLLESQIINRFNGMLELFPAIGKAIGLLFSGKFKEAGTVAFDAVAKVTTGVANASSKIGAMIDETTKLVKAGISNGEKIANFQKDIDKRERALVEGRAKTSLEVSKLRAKAVELEGDAKRKAIQEAIALEQSLSKEETDLARRKLGLANLNVEANGNDKDALNAVAAARAALSTAEETAFSNTLKFKKELESLDKEELKRLEEIQKIKDEIGIRDQKALQELDVLRLTVQANELTDAQGKADKLIEIEKLKSEQLLANDKLTANERALILEESNEVIRGIQKEADEQKFEDIKAELALELEGFKEHTQGLINEKKLELLEGKISQEEYNQEISDLNLAALEAQLLIKKHFGEEDKILAGQITDYKIALGQKELEIAKEQNDQRVNAVKDGLGTIAGAFNKQSVAFKVLASAQTLINTYQSATAAFNSLANIPYVGTVLGAIAAAAAVASGLANVAKINSTQLPKLAEGGIIPISGKRHSQGGEKVTIGGRAVAEVEDGENMVILKRGSSSLLRNLSTINQLAGGVDFFNDRAPRRYLADGGIVSRAASSQVSSFQNLSIAEDLKKVKIITRISDIDRAYDNVNIANVTSELS